MTVVTEPTTDVGISDNDTTGEDWWCIRVDAFKAPAPCNHQVIFVSGVMEGQPCHKVIVWPEKDHEDLLRIAALSQKRDRNPRIVEYKENFGPWINFDNYRLYGGPMK